MYLFPFFTHQGWQSKFDEWVEVNSWRVEGHHVHTAVTGREKKLIENKRLKEQREKQEEQEMLEELAQETQPLDLMEVDEDL